jgi:hypothetical protein
VRLQLGARLGDEEWLAISPRTPGIADRPGVFGSSDPEVIEIIPKILGKNLVTGLLGENGFGGVIAEVRA